MATDTVALRLRFGEHQTPQAPPDIAAFRPRPSPSLATRVHPHLEEVGVVDGARSLPPRAPLVIFFQHAGYGVPAITTGQDDRCPDVSCWSMRPTLFGYLASVPRVRRARVRSRAAWVVAACLPLVLPAQAVAAPELSEVRVSQAPSVPVPPDSEGAPAEPDPEIEREPPSSLGPAGPSEATLPSPEPHEGLTGFDSTTVDAAWEGVDGFDVELELKGGREMRGRIGAVQRETFTLIEAATGAVLVLPKSGVVAVRVQIASPLPAKNGGGALAGGIVLTSLGSPVFISGVAILGVCPSCTPIHLPLLLVGGAALGGGIPLIVRGARARRLYQEALQERAFAPVVARTPHGWTGGLQLRF